MELRLAVEKAYWAGSYERETQRALWKLAQPSGTAWDVGANVGFFSLLLARRCTRVVAVEAAGDTVARLRRNVALNSAPVDVVHAALAGSERTVLIAPHDLPEMRKIGDEGEPVETVTLDGLLERYGRPDVVKLDVEGAEVEALDAASELLAAHPALVVEMHGEASRERVLDVLRGAGYDVALLGPWRAVATYS